MRDLLRAVIINTSDIQGGAARAANRLHDALKNNAVGSSMVVMHKSSSDPSVLETGGFAPIENIDHQYVLRKLVQRYYINSARTELSDTLFSFAYPGCDITSTPLVQSADIINLHWIGFFQTPITIHKLMQLGKPIVWTLHDMCPFTGGCHYSAGCKGYTRECRDCPQLANDPYSLPNAILKDKLKLFKGFPLTIVSPSRWLADCARESALFSHCRIEVIPNSVETDIYAPLAKNNAKESLGIDSAKTVLMFGAGSSGEKRKGLAKLEAALRRAKSNPQFEEAIRKGLTILLLGPLTADVSNLGLEIVALGNVTDDKAIAQAYSAADLFILPSLEDNLPNMMLEAMACGIPVLAFETGGVPDVLTNGVNGVLVPQGDVDALAENIVALVGNEALRQSLGAEATAYAQRAFAPNIQAERYITLFQELISQHAPDVGRMPKAAGASIRTANFDMTCGPYFEEIRFKVMLESLLKAIPEICSGYAGKGHTKDREEIQRLMSEITGLRKSLSWRLTAPLRRAVDWSRSIW